MAVNLAAELRSMADWLELDRVATTDRGDLAPALRKAGVARDRRPLTATRRWVRSAW